jgi:hypothetical protein
MAVLYEHWRSDTNECFYVGIGLHDDGRRAHKLIARNPHHGNVLEKAERDGFEIFVVIKEDNLDWETAKIREKMHIAYWRGLVGERLTNITTGGDGTNGFKHTEETKADFRIRFSGKGNPNYGKHWDETHRRILSKAVSGENAFFYGKTRPEHSNLMSSEGNPMFGKSRPDVARYNRERVNPMTGKPAHNRGKKASVQTRVAQSFGHLVRKFVYYGA